MAWTRSWIERFISSWLLPLTWLLMSRLRSPKRAANSSLVSGVSSLMPVVPVQLLYASPVVVADG
jgi:hypothetical protein